MNFINNDSTNSENLEKILTHYNKKKVECKIIETGGGGDCLFYCIAFCLTNVKNNKAVKDTLREYLSNYYLSDKFTNIKIYTKISNFNNPDLKNEYTNFLNKEHIPDSMWTLENYFNQAESLKSDLKDMVLKPFQNMGIFKNGRELTFDENKIKLPYRENSGQKLIEINSLPFIKKKNDTYYYKDKVLFIQNTIDSLIPYDENLQKELLHKIKENSVFKNILAEKNFYLEYQNKKHINLYFSAGKVDGIRGGPLNYWSNGDIKKLEENPQGKIFLNEFLKAFKIMYASHSRKSYHYGDYEDIRILEKSLSIDRHKINILIFTPPDDKGCIKYGGKIENINDINNIFLTIFNYNQSHYRVLGINFGRNFKYSFETEDIPELIRNFINDCGTENFVNTLFFPDFTDPKILLDPNTFEYKIDGVKTNCFLKTRNDGICYLYFDQAKHNSKTDYRYVNFEGKKYFYSDNRHNIQDKAKKKKLPTIEYYIFGDNLVNLPVKPYFYLMADGNYQLFSKIVHFYMNEYKINYNKQKQTFDTIINIFKHPNFFSNEEEQINQILQWIFPINSIKYNQISEEILNDYVIFWWNKITIANQNLTTILNILVQKIKSDKEIIKPYISYIIIFARELGVTVLYNFLKTNFPENSEFKETRTLTESFNLKNRIIF